MRKKKIYYSRTYRHLAINHKKNLLYGLFVVVPCLIVLFANLDNLTHFISVKGIYILDSEFPGIGMNLIYDKISFLNEISYIEMPTQYPGFLHIVLNIAVTAFIIFLLCTGKRKGRPLFIFFALSMFVHFINSIFFLLAGDHFPYTVGNFSRLYMEQQIGIWIIFLVLSYLVTAFVGDSGYFYKIITFFIIMTYSLVFGAVRYIVFLYILEKLSVLYMSLMFFVFGPVFDFLYLVCIYSFFIDKMVKYYDEERNEESWKWA